MELGGWRSPQKVESSSSMRKETDEDAVMAVNGLETIYRNLQNQYSNIIL